MLEKRIQEMNFSSTLTSWIKKVPRDNLNNFLYKTKFSRHLNGYDKARLIDFLCIFLFHLNKSSYYEQVSFTDNVNYYLNEIFNKQSSLMRHIQSKLLGTCYALRREVNRLDSYIRLQTKLQHTNLTFCGPSTSKCLCKL